MAEEEDLDVSGFVQEDVSAASDEHEEQLQARIEEEHAKYKEQQQKWQAQVRAARPWSAPPLSSPRPESQRIKKHESAELARSPAVMFLASNPREVYVPPPRNHLHSQPGQGEHRPASADMAHLGPPRPASADTPRLRSMLGSTGMVSIKHSGLADIQEESPLTPHHDNGNGHSATQTKAESHHSTEDASSHHTSNSASPSQQLGPSSPHESHQAAAASPPHEPHPPGPADEGASPQQQSPPSLEHKQSGICSDDTYSDDGEGHEDLLGLLDQEEALKNNMLRYQEETARSQEAQGAKSSEPGQDVCEHGSPSPDPSHHTPQEEHDSKDAQAAHDSAQASPPHTADPHQAHESPSQAAAHAHEWPMPHTAHAQEAPGSPPAQAAPQEYQLPVPQHEPLSLLQQAGQEGGKDGESGAEHEGGRGGESAESGAEQEESSGSSSSGSGSEAEEGRTDGESGESGGEEDEPGEGGLLPPHKFALHLMAHDLRTLPAHLGGHRSSGPKHHSQQACKNSRHSSSGASTLRSLHTPSPKPTAATAPAAAGVTPARTYPPGRFSPPPLGTHHATFPPHGSAPATSHAAYLNPHRAAPTAKQGMHTRSVSPGASRASSPSSSAQPSPTHAVPPGATSLDRQWDQWTPAQLRQHLGLSTRPLSAASSKSASAKSVGTVGAAKRPRPSSAMAGGSSTLAATGAGLLRRNTGGRAWSTGGGAESAAGAHRPSTSPYSHHHHHLAGLAEGGAHDAYEGGQHSSVQRSTLGWGEVERSRMLGSLGGGDSVREEMPSMRTLAVESQAGAHEHMGARAGSTLQDTHDGLDGRSAAGGAGAFASQRAVAPQGGGASTATATGGGVLKYEDWFAKMMGVATGGAACEASSPPAPSAHAAPATGAADGVASDPEGHASASSSPGESRAQQQERHLSSPTGSSAQGVSTAQGRPKERGAQQSRPSTAPSSRHAASRAPPYGLQSLLTAHMDPPPPHQPHAASPYEPSGAPGWRVEPTVPHRPFSAHARLRGGAYGSPPAQYNHLLSGPESAGAWGMAVPAFHPSPAPPAPQKVDSTAAVHVGGATVSVYVEDTTRRILEANRCMALLELRSRYRLRSRLSNMVVQVYDSTWQPPEELDAAWSQGAPQSYDPGEKAACTAPTTKELTIKQFLARHMRLKAQASLSRSLAGVAAGAGVPPSTAAGGGRLRRPKSASYGPQALQYPQGKPARQRPMSAHGGGVQGRSGVGLRQARASYPDKGEEACSVELHIPPPPKAQPLYVSVPCVPEARSDIEWADQGAGGWGPKAGSTPQVLQELDGLAEECQVFSKNISMLGGVVC